MELGAMKAFKFFWALAKIIASLFHVGQDWFKKFCKQGLKAAYGEDEKLSNWFKKLFTKIIILKK